MRNRIFGWIMTVGFVAGGGEVAAQEPLRQGPQEEGVVLRFDEARRDTLADVPSATAETLPGRCRAAVRLQTQPSPRNPRRGLRAGYIVERPPRAGQEPSYATCRYDTARTGATVEILRRTRPPQGRAAASAR